MLFPMSVSLPPDDLRPQFHFTAPTGWLNDPNGLVYENGKYHLFYQHNPHGTQWGNMTWGHAVSKDLIHWEHLPLALHPDSMGTMYSGSAIIDKANVVGVGAGAIVCFYTAAGGENEESKGKPYTQGLAWSTDGKTFNKLAGNPIIGNVAEGNRDPKVVWHEASKQWAMALYLTGDRYAIFNSVNLKDWTKSSEFQLKGSGECPDLLELPLDGKSDAKKWVFWGADGKYQVGDFDGKNFEPKTAVLNSYFGNTGYAAQTYSNAPGGRCIQISWMRGSDFPNQVWNQQMAFPHVLTLRNTELGPKLFFWPVDEIRSLRGPKISGAGGLFAVPSGLIDFEGEWTVPDQGTLEIKINGVVATFDAEFHRLSVLGRDVQVPIRNGKLKIRGLADRTTLELYVQEGEILMPFFALPKEGAEHGIRVNGRWKGGVNVYELSP
jgi:fructan beta-fructosidase